jgi:CBS domain containing-hemolysin-like protein
MGIIERMEGMFWIGTLVGLIVGVGAAWLWARRAKLRAEEPTTRDETLRAIVEAADEGSELEGESLEMIEGIFDLGETRAREVMVPRLDVVSMPIDATLSDALDVILRCGHSRIPVHRGSIDQVAGVLYAKDLLTHYRQQRYDDVDIAAMIRPAYFVPESKTLDELLPELQSRRVHLAVVVDEHGGTAGVVTIEDLLEEIVGEIHDEFDAEEPDVISLDDASRVGVFRAGIDIDDVNRLLGLRLPADGDSDTLGGLVIDQLGRVARAGDVATFEDAEIEVLQVEGRRIRHVRCRAIVQEGEGAAAAAADAAADAAAADAPTQPANGGGDPSPSGVPPAVS